MRFYRGWIMGLTLMGLTGFNLDARPEDKTETYVENGKKYYRPARLKTTDLPGFKQLGETRQKRIVLALELAHKNGWLKYRFGGSSPQAKGFDCSGAMHYLLDAAGYQAPRTSAQQYVWLRDAGRITAVPEGVKSIEHKAFAKLQPGDLLFWSGTYVPRDGRKVNITHVSMYLGREKDGRHVMIGSSKGRSYRGKRGDGYGVYDFRLPRQGSRARFVGYGTPPVPAAAKKSTSSSKRAKATPNVVIIYGDDVGYGDLGAYGAKLIPTPHLDKLAQQSLVFTDGHCSAATCTPSRFSLLTGIHGFRHGVRVLPPDAPMTIKPGMLTLPQLFKKAGYTTAVIGKWHLGLGDGKTPVNWNGEVKPGPGEIGFDYSFLLPSTNDRVPCVYLENHRVVNLDSKDPVYVGKKPENFQGTVYPDGRKNRAAMTYYPSSHGHNHSVINGIGRIGQQWGGQSALWNDETMADEFVQQARRYLAGQKTSQPFFLYFASQDIHVPRTPHPRFIGKSKLSYRGDAMVQLDWSVGAILAALEENGLADNTMVIFSSDNGPVYDDGYQDGTTVHTSTEESDRGHDGSGPYRGGKYQIYEGGTRVPLIIRWPGKIKAGRSTAMINQIDFLASFASMLGIALQPDQAMDSRNVFPALIGQDQVGTSVLLEEARGVALRQENWKYIPARSRKKKAQKAELYDLSKDPGEQNNVIDVHEQKARQMRALLDKLIKDKRGVRRVLGGSTAK